MTDYIMNRSEEQDLLNVEKYTDNELYDLLDLNHPTDRELEAKILFFIKNYETIINSSTNGNNIATKNAKQMLHFFESIYQRFFQIEDDDEDAEETEGFSNMAPASIATTIANAVQSQSDICFNTITTQVLPGNPLSNTSLITQQTPNQPNISDQNIGYTRNFDYSKSYTNPLLKETITRIISIDSQFRDQSVYSDSTNYTFNLSDTLQDVVSLKLYSIQLPYNWWTISKSFGSNFFYIKGASPGIIGYDYQISINSGTYQEPSDLILAIQNSIAELKKTYSDVSFGTTNLTVGQPQTSTPNSLATVVIDITNLYNETYYYLDWNYWTTPANKTDRLHSIPGYLGFYEKIYTPNSIYSTSIAKSIITNNTFSFIVNNNNNYFSIYLYDGSNDASYTVSSELFKIKITIPTGSYTRNQLFDAVNTSLQSNINTDPAISSNPLYSNPIDTTLSNISIIPDPTSPTDKSQYKLTIQLNRFANPYSSVSNIKTAIVFPTETTNPVWIAPDQNNPNNIGCFYFQTNINELNTITSETLSLVSTYDFSDTTPYIYFQCTKPTYEISANDIIITIPPAKYTLDEFMNTINTRFDANTNTQKSIVTIKNAQSNMDFQLYINKRFYESNYRIDFSGCYLNTTMNYRKTYSSTDLSTNSVLYSSFSVQGGGYTVTGKNTFYIYPDSSNGNQSSPGYVVNIPVPTSGSYVNYQDLATAINCAFQNTTPNIYNQNTQTYYTFDNLGGTFINVAPFSKTNDLAFTNISIDPSNNSSYLISTLNVTINNVLSSKDYKVTFRDSSNNNIWSTNFYISSSPYDLSSTYDTNTGFSDVSGTQSVGNNKITIDSNNQTFWLRARPNIDGIYTSDGATDISFTIPIGTYTKEQLLPLMNVGFSNNPITKGTIIITDTTTLKTNIRFNINKVYTAEDYNLVFYDIYSFIFCNIGVTGSSSKRNITKDATLGWILGFRYEMIYNLSDPTTIDSRYRANIPLQGSIYNGTKIATLMGDTTVNTNLYNYFLLVLNDYTQNHLNDGLVTLITKDTSIPLPSYADRTTYVCDPVTGKLTLPSSITNTNSSGNALTQKQLYSANAILQNQQVQNNLFSNGPFIQDVFALIPIKLTSLNIGQVYVEYGGTLQQQERSYFGPVNINRMSVQLITDRGDILDLNGANWSFGLVCQQMYHPPNS